MLHFKECLRRVAEASAMTIYDIEPVIQDTALHMLKAVDGAMGEFHIPLRLIILRPRAIWKYSANNWMDYNQLLVYVLAHEFRHAQQHKSNTLPMPDPHRYYKDGIIDQDKWKIDPGEKDALDYAEDVTKHMSGITMLDISEFLIHEWRGYNLYEDPLLFKCDLPATL